MKTVFLGTPQFAVPTLEALVAAGHEVVAVFTQPDRPKGRGQEVAFSPVKECALRHSLPVFQPAKVRQPEVVEQLEEIRPDVMVVVGYGQIIPQSIIDLPRSASSTCTPRCCPDTAARRRSSGPSPMAKRSPA